MVKEQKLMQKQEKNLKLLNLTIITKSLFLGVKKNFFFNYYFPIVNILKEQGCYYNYSNSLKQLFILFEKNKIKPKKIKKNLKTTFKNKFYISYKVELKKELVLLGSRVILNSFKNIKNSTFNFWLNKKFILEQM
eukprot:TRINITY_DN128_c0_g1_i2.p3 TRINITY_DN128_c0_g1~~TRINITY_DN128_c0_g1_i2.p3  ORF type:complete len:135 (-),score=23.07 TRINITY_DN128_c0_g1_i2:937-1341(-)